MTEIFAVKPPRGRVVHLHLPGYQPPGYQPSTYRDRTLKDRVAMCGNPIWPNGTPAMEHSLAPLAIALRWTSLKPSETDPRPTWSWCRPCMGHAVELHGLQHAVLTEVCTRLTPPGGAS